MRKKINTAILILILSTTISCSSKRYEPIISKEEFNEVADFLIDKKGIETCPILIKLTKWETGYLQSGEQWWGRDYSILSRSGHLVSSSSIGLDGRTDTVQESQNKQKNLAYIGPWKYVKPIGKKIRFFATQHISGHNLYLQYESYSSQRAKIKEKPLTLIKKKRRPRGECLTRWFNKFGHNAIAESHRQLIPGFWNWIFRNHETIITGKIIQVEE